MQDALNLDIMELSNGKRDHVPVYYLINQSLCSHTMRP
jgi:hypothetical protein